MSTNDSLKTAPSAEVVVFSFLSRVDKSPLNERPRSPGHVLDVTGRTVPDDKLDEALDPLGARPDAALEKWAEYWRKVHGPRFLYGEDSALDGLGALKQYVQLHRHSAGPNSDSRPPYVAPVGEDGKLFSTIAGHIPEFVRPIWDGVAFLTFDSVSGISDVLGSRRFQEKISPEDKAIFRGVFPMLGRKHEVIAPGDHTVGVTMLRLHFASPEFRRVATIGGASSLEMVRAQVASKHYGKDIKSYTILENQVEASTDGPFNNAMTERLSAVSLIGFSSMRKLEDFVVFNGNRGIFEFESEFCENSEYHTVINFDVSP